MKHSLAVVVLALAAPTTAQYGFVNDSVDPLAWFLIADDESAANVVETGKAPAPNSAWARMECTYAFMHGDAFARDSQWNKETFASKSKYHWRRQDYVYIGTFVEGDWYITGTVHVEANGLIVAGQGDGMFHGAAECEVTGGGGDGTPNNLHLNEHVSINKRTTTMTATFGTTFAGFGGIVPIVWVTGAGTAEDTDGDSASKAGTGVFFTRKNKTKGLIDVRANGSPGNEGASDIHALGWTKSTITLTN